MIHYFRIRRFHIRRIFKEVINDGYRGLNIFSVLGEGGMHGRLHSFFICGYLLTLSVVSDDNRMIIWEECGRRRPRPNLRQPFQLLELDGVRKTTRSVCEVSQSPCRDLNPGPPGYEAGVRAIWPLRLDF
jgi:hypothetical protein